MNNSSANFIKRQLLIIQFLLESNFVSAVAIQEFLASKGFDTQLRTIQRDMVTLEEILPLDCRKDDKPYSWRWKRLTQTHNHQMTISQALALRLVETELQDVLPTDMYARLNPLFIKAKYIHGLSALDSNNNNLEDNKTSKLPLHQPNGIIPSTPSTILIFKLRSILTKAKAKSTKTHEKTMAIEKSEQVEINNLIKILQQKDLQILAEMLKEESH